MADNMIELVASLNVDDSAKQINTVDIPKLQKKIEGIKIKCELDTEGISSIQSQLANISKNSKLDIPKVEVQTGTRQSGQNIENVAKSVETVTNKVLTLKKTLADLDSRFVEAFKAVENPDGIINAERTMAVIQSRLSSLGTVTVTGKYNDQESEDSINKIIARIEAASGEVRELNFLLDSTGQKFEYIGGSYSDKGVGKIQQDLARLSKELANFEASHKSIESGLIDPLTTARNAIIDLESGVGSVESAQKAIDNLKTVAANIGSNLKSTGSSFNVFDNAANKAKNFDNTIKTLKMDIESLSPSTSKSSLVSQLDLAIERMNEFKNVESQSGRGVEWSQRYGEISSLLQNITNNLKVAQKEENAFNKEFEQAVREEEKQLAIGQKRVETARQLRELQQHNYWQGRFEETIKGMTAENQVLKDMKRYYEDLNKAQKEVEKQEKKIFQEDNRVANLQNRIKRLTADINSYAVANKRAVESTKQMSSGKSFADEWSRITSVMAKGADLTDRELKDLSADMAVFRKEVQAAGLAGESAFGKFANSFKVMSSYITANMVFNFVKRQLRDMVNEVTAIDTAMTELRKVTEATNAEFEAFAKSAGQTGRELGASISDVINATSTFSRAGFNLPDAEELGKVATLYKNVGDGITIDSASESIISIMKAFNIEASDSERIIDRINKVSNNFAVDSGGLGESLKRIASAMASANNTLDETIALTTVANEIVQDPVAVAQAWRTVSMRIRGAKAELEQAGEDTEGMVESTAKLQGLIKGMTGIDIMVDENTFKSTYEIIKELGTVWNNLQDIEQAQVLEAIAGKRQANVVASALRNYERLDDVLQTSIDSQGSARAEQEEYAKSIQYSLDTLKATYQDFADSIVNSDFVKNLLGTAQSFLEVLTKIIDKFGTLPTILTSIAAVGGLKNIGLFGSLETGLTGEATKFETLKQVLSYDFEGLYKKFNINLSGISDDEVQSLQNYVNALNAGTKPAKAMKDIMVETSEVAQQQATQFTYLYQSYQRGEISANQYKIATQNLALTQKTAIATSKALSIALNTLVNAGIMIVINLAIKGVSALVDKLVVTKGELTEIRDEAISSIEELRSNIEHFTEETDAIDTLVQRYKEINLSILDTNEAKEELAKIQTDLIDKFGGEANGIDLVNGKYEEQLDVIERLSKARYDEWKRENAAAISRAQKVSEYNVGWYNNVDGKLIGDEEYSQLFLKGYIEHTDELAASLYKIKDVSEDIQNIYKNVSGTDFIDGIFSNDLLLSGTLEDARDQLGRIIDEYSKLDFQSSETLSTLVTHYKALNKTIEDTEFYMSKIREYEASPMEIVGVVDTPNLNNMKALISAMGDARTEWFKALDEMEGNFGKTVDSMSSALQKLVDGKNLSSSEFWDLMELDTDKIITDIKMVGDEFTIDQQQLIQLKDQQIQKQIDSLQIENSTLETKKKTLSVAIEQAKAELSILGARGLANEAYRKEYQDAVNSIKQGERNLQDYGDQIRRNNILITQWNSKLGDTADRTESINKQIKELQDQADKYAKAMTDAVQNVIDGLENEKQQLEDEKQILDDQLDVLNERKESIEETIEQYKSLVGIVKDATDAEIDVLKKQQQVEEDAIQARIDALKEQHDMQEEENSLAEKELELRKKLADLDKAKSTKVRTYSAERGWHFDADKEAVANAQTAVSEAQKAYDDAISDKTYNDQIKALEAEKKVVAKNYEAEIKSYEDYYKQWSDITEEQSKAEEEQLAQQILGSDWREKIKAKDSKALAKFTSDFRGYNVQLNSLVNGEIASLKKSIEAKEDEINAKNKQIDAWKRYKTQVEDTIDNITNKYKDYTDALGAATTAEGDSYETREEKLRNFATQYESLINEINGYQSQIEGLTIPVHLDDKDAREKIGTLLDDYANAMSEMSRALEDTPRSMHKWVDDIRNIYGFSQGGVADFTGVTTVHGTKQRAETIFNASQSKELYDMVKSGSFVNVVADKAYAGLSSAISKMSSTTDNSNRVININGLTIKADNPMQFHDQFMKEIGQYWNVKLTEVRTR